MLGSSLHSWERGTKIGRPSITQKYIINEPNMNEVLPMTNQVIRTRAGWNSQDLCESQMMEDHLIEACMVPLVEDAACQNTKEKGKKSSLDWEDLPSL